MTRCKYVIKQGKRVGEKCGRKQLENDLYCTHHCENKDRYKKIINANKKYETLVHKVNIMMLEDEDLLNILNNDYKRLHGELLGVQKFLDPKIKKNESKYCDFYLKYYGDNVQSAICKKKTLKIQIKDNKEKRATIETRLESLADCAGILCTT